MLRCKIPKMQAEGVGSLVYKSHNKLVAIKRKFQKPLVQLPGPYPLDRRGFLRFRPKFRYKHPFFFQRLLKLLHPYGGPLMRLLDRSGALSKGYKLSLLVRVTSARLGILGVPLGWRPP